MTPLCGDDNNKQQQQQSLYLNATVFIHAEWLHAVRASSPNWWGELFYKGLSVYPIPSYPALLHKDTTSWNKDDQDYII